MIVKNKIGLIIDQDFGSKNTPPHPHPIFLSYESPLRLKVILDFLEIKKVFLNERIKKIEPMSIEDSILELSHTKYHINSVKNSSNRGYGLLDEEVFITKDTFHLAKKAVGGTIQAIQSVLESDINQSIALVRPPGHHALQEKASGLCIFNNIATSILYLKKQQQNIKKIAIIDIDAHFGDGLVQYFYDDPSVLYFSVHEFDFVEGDIGFIDEVGVGEGLGKNINFPMPLNISDNEFLEIMDILIPVLHEFNPDIIIIATGLDLHFSDPIGNGLLTSMSYYKFTKQLLNVSEKICNGKLAFVLEGGYSLVGLPLCIYAIIQALLEKEYQLPVFEQIRVSTGDKIDEIEKIKAALKKLLANYWNCFK